MLVKSSVTTNIRSFVHLRQLFFFDTSDELKSEYITFSHLNWDGGIGVLESYHSGTPDYWLVLDLDNLFVTTVSSCSQECFTDSAVFAFKASGVSFHLPVFRCCF